MVIIRIRFVLSIIVFLLLFGCSPSSSNSQNIDKLSELYVAAITDASDWNTKPEFLAITEKSFANIEATTKDRILTKLNSIYEDVYIFEDIKNDEDKFRYKNNDDSEDIIQVNGGMIIDVDLEEYEEAYASIRVKAHRGADVGIIPEYEATYEDGDWKLKKVVQAEI